ncbi:acyl-CoA dehydrogenase family protein [Rhodococcus globerulus]|uniref:Acyl-CoA dehydrogenase family protein n=1 Tax=Rhodococcus globerulus TaxID=33008 RepID=A0ABU4C4K4_RHOGO|nr:acyl-CoA dehydrogenase family protein [Rhodococcus globerulus]MDV6271339.1 acyl-CoA dehydrogenase family protein [Rhodococcus globerulus]
MDFDFTPEQLELKERARAAGLVWRGRHKEWDSENQSPYAEITKAMRDAGLLGLTIPKEYGGKGGTALDYVIVVEELFRTSQSWILGEPPFCTTGPGPSMVLLADEEETRQKFLPDIVAGVKGCAIALTEPDHGSDLTDLETIAIEDGDHYVVSGTKRFITGSPENEIYAVFARFDGIPGAKGVGCILVEKGTPGLELLPGATFVGSRGLPHGEVHMDNCRVPAENLISGAGSFAKLMTAFNMERLHNSIYSLAFAEAAYEETVQYCENRKSFGKDIIEFQATYHTLVDMHVQIEAHRLLTYKAAVTAIDSRFPRPLESTVSKLSGAMMLPTLTQHGLLLHGGDGATLDYPIQQIHRDAIAAMVAGGSPPVLRNAIASQLFPDRRFSQK